MTRKHTLVAALLATTLTPVVAQPVAKQSPEGLYAIPYASQTNRIDLEVVNSTNGSLKDVAVQLNGSPVWLTFEATTAGIGVLKPGESKTTTFTFDLDEKAPVGEVADLRFDVSSATGQLESKTMKIEAEAPTELILRGNGSPAWSIMPKRPATRRCHGTRPASPTGCISTASSSKPMEAGG